MVWLIAAGCTAVVDLDGRGVDGHEVSVGSHAACMATETDHVFCWGDLDLTGSDISSSWWRPQLVNLEDGGAKVHVGDGFILAETWIGRLYCWGANDQGQCGSWPEDRIDAPRKLDEPGFVDAVCVGGRHACAIDDGELFCWGANDQYQLTDLVPVGSDRQYVRIPLGNDDPVVEVACGHSHTCARTEPGDLYCWGRTTTGQTGAPLDPVPPRPQVDNEECQPTAHRVADATEIVQIAAGLTHTCVRRDDGAILCWGSNEAGQLGISNVEGGPGLRVPVAAPSGQRWRNLDVGAEHTCAVDQKFALYCWGSHRSGQVGSGKESPSTRADPFLVPLPDEALRISAFDNNTCAAVGHYRQIYCWGANSAGQIPDAGPHVQAPTRVEW